MCTPSLAGTFSLENALYGATICCFATCHDDPNWPTRKKRSFLQNPSTKAIIMFCLLMIVVYCGDAKINFFFSSLKAKIYDECVRQQIELNSSQVEEERNIV